MKRITLIVVLLALLAPGALLAQSADVSLQGLAGYVRSLQQRVGENEQRLAAIETRLAPTATAIHTPTPTSTPAITATPPGPTPTVTPTPLPAESYPRYQVAQIFDEYEANEARASAKYLNKTIEVTGDIVDIEKRGGSVWSGRERYEVTLDGEAFLRYLDCDFPLSSENEIFELSAGQKVTLRGTVFSGSFVKVHMVDCSIVK